MRGHRGQYVRDKTWMYQLRRTTDSSPRKHGKPSRTKREQRSSAMARLPVSALTRAVCELSDCAGFSKFDSAAEFHHDHSRPGYLNYSE